MRVNGTKVDFMVTVSSFRKDKKAFQVTLTRVIGFMGKSKAKELKHGVMEQSTKALTTMTKNTEKVLFI